MPQKRSAWLLLVDMVDRPGAALANVAAYPRWRWLLPVALALVTTVAGTAIASPLLAAETQQLMAQQLSRLSADQAALVQQQMTRFATPLALTISGSLGALVGLAIGWLLQAAIAYFGVLISGGDAEFGEILAAAPWVALPAVIESIAQAVHVLLYGKLLVNRGLSYLVSSGKALEDARNPAYIALSQVTLFRLWHLLLVYVLLRRVAKLGSGSAFIVTVIYWALVAGGQLLLASLSRLLVPNF
jgi:hypothetical protein